MTLQGPQPTQGGQKGGSGLQGPPGERSTGRPSPPPPGRHFGPDRTRTPEGRRRPEGGQD